MAYQSEKNNLIPQTRIFVISNQPGRQDFNKSLLQEMENLSDIIKFVHPIQLAHSTHEKYTEVNCSLSIIILNVDEEDNLLKKLEAIVEQLPLSIKYFIYVGPSEKTLENLIRCHYMPYDALITKDFDYKTFNILAADIYNILKKSSLSLKDSDIITISVQRQKYFLKLDDILFIITDSYPHRLIFHLKNTEYQTRMTLKQVYHQCKKLTVCHEGALVNLQNVTKFNKHKRILYFENGDTCEVSKRYIKSISEKIPMKTV